MRRLEVILIALIIAILIGIGITCAIKVQEIDDRQYYKERSEQMHFIIGLEHGGNYYD